MTCGFSEEELYVLYRICLLGRNCPHKHIRSEDFLSGFPPQDCKEYRKALKKLINKGYIGLKKSQGRDDICFARSKFYEVLQAFKAHEQEYKFIIRIEHIERLLKYR